LLRVNLFIRLNTWILIKCVIFITSCKNTIQTERLEERRVNNVWLWVRKRRTVHHNTKETLNCCEKKEDQTLPAPTKIKRPILYNSSFKKVKSSKLKKGQLKCIWQSCEELFLFSDTNIILCYQRRKENLERKEKDTLKCWIFDWLFVLELWITICNVLNLFSSVRRWHLSHNVGTLKLILKIWTEVHQNIISSTFFKDLFHTKMFWAFLYL